MSSRIIQYARSRPNGKMIVDSIENGPYVRRMIATLGEPDLPDPVPESLHEQTNEELTKTDIKRMDIDDQAIQTILLGLLKDVYAAVDSCETAKEIWKRSGQYAGQVAQNQQGFNAWQNGGIQGLRVLELGIKPGDLDEIEEVNANCILMANLQQASTSGTQHDKAPVYDTDGSAEVHLNDNCYDNKIFNMFTQEEQYTDLLEPILEPQLEPQNDNIVTSVATSMVHSGGRMIASSVKRSQGKSSNTPSASNILDPLNQKLESKIVELEFQVVNYEREISHLKTTYKNLFDSIKSNRAHAKLHDLNFKNAKLRARLFENTFESVKNTLGMSVTPHVDKPKLSAVTPLSKKLHVSMPSHFVPQPREFNVVKHRNVIAPGMFKINPSQMPRVDLVPNKQSSASIKTNSITNSQRHVIDNENVSSNMATASSTGLVHTARTRRPHPKGNTRNAKVPSASKSSEVKKIVTVKDHHRTLLLFMNQKTMPSECNNIKLAIRNDKSKIVCDTCKQCLVTANHDACLTPSINVLNSRANKLCANVPLSANQKRHRTQVWKPKQVGSKERLASKPRLPRHSLKWSPSRRSFDQKGKLVASKGTNYPNDDKACTSNPQEPMRKQFPNLTVFLG
nr:hypothetical protein [Tanacetum cinerariifolium]